MNSQFLMLLLYIGYSQGPLLMGKSIQSLARNMENISSRFLKKLSDQRKLRLLSVYFSVFEWRNLQLGKIGVLVNLITQKLKSKHLAFSVFSGQRFFWGNERKYFPHISDLWDFCFPCYSGRWSSSESQCCSCSWTALLNVN